MRRERGSGNTACNVFYQWNSIIADVAHLLTSFTTNARLLNLRNAIVLVADRARLFSFREMWLMTYAN